MPTQQPSPDLAQRRRRRRRGRRGRTSLASARRQRLSAFTTALATATADLSDTDLSVVLARVEAEARREAHVLRHRLDPLPVERYRLQALDTAFTGFLESLENPSGYVTAYDFSDLDGAIRDALAGIHLDEPYE